ncbi:MAG TPA: phosphomethylpyrimidine synthase ThiC, partial [Pirellulales bacterium]|nr:phosphomethylpyrimidine synthase ThiC [Pirellulales bacterium]
MTQIEQARAGTITPEMQYVAERERLEPETVRSEVARGRMVIPANKVHLTGRLEPMAIGVAAKTKINANIGNSAVTSDIDGELEKLHTAVHFGADTVMDLSTGKDIDRIRAAIIAASPVPIGTVPIYQMLEELGGSIEDMRPQHFLDMVEHQAKQGVDYMTVHSGVLLEALPLTMNRITGIVSRGGSLIAKWMMAHRQQNPLYTHFED